MKSRIYLLSFCLFLAFVVLTSTQAKADSAPDNYYNHYSGNNNSTSLAVNYRVAFIEVAIVVIGVVIIKNARVAINAKLKSANEETFVN